MKFLIQLCGVVAISVATSVHAAGYWAPGLSSKTSATIGAQVLPPFQVSGNGSAMLLVHNAPEWLGNRLSRISRSAEPLLLSNSTPTNTVLNIAGEPGTAFSVSMPSESLISISNGSQALLLIGTLSANLRTGLLDMRGHHRLTINADFSLQDSLKLHGLFNGHFPVTVEHN